MGSYGGDQTTKELVRFYLVDHRTRVGQAIDVGLLVLNLAFIGILVADTYTLPQWGDDLLWQLEVVVVAVFLVEYVLRLYSAPDVGREFLNPYTMIDLASILPTLAILVLPGVAAGTTLGLLRLARVVRVLRFWRFTQDQEFFFGTVSLGRLRAMKLMLTVISIFFIYALAFHQFEAATNPGIANFGDAFYFAVVSLTTVGFGDITPTTQGGRWVTVAAILVAVIVIPWEVRKIVRNWATADKVNVTCPNCGLAYHDPDASHCKACGSVIYQEYDSRGE